MKQYVITDADIEVLKTRIDRDPRHGRDGGSSVGMSDAEIDAFMAAHRFYWYQISKWVEEVTK